MRACVCVCVHFHVSRCSDCDLGQHRSLIIPPYTLSLKLVGWRSGKRDVINELTAPSDSAGWSPLLVLANPRSGGNEAQLLMRAFRSLLNPVQVRLHIT